MHPASCLRDLYAVRDSDVNVYMESMTHLHIDIHTYAPRASCLRDLYAVRDSDVDVYTESTTHLHIDIYTYVPRASCFKYLSIVFVTQM